MKLKYILILIVPIVASLGCIQKVEPGEDVTVVLDSRNPTQSYKITLDGGQSSIDVSIDDKLVASIPYIKENQVYYYTLYSEKVSTGPHTIKFSTNDGPSESRKFLNNLEVNVINPTSNTTDEQKIKNSWSTSWEEQNEIANRNNGGG